MKVAIIGDVHKNFDKLKETLIYLKRTENISTVIQVGDLGLNEYFAFYLESLSTLLSLLKIKFYFIDGNYDNIDWLKKKSNGRCSKVEIQPNIYYMPRGSILKLGGKTFFFCGGGYSANQKKRLKNINYWEAETLTDSEVFTIKERYKDQPLQCDFFIAHDTIEPFNHQLSYFPRWFSKLKWPVDVNHRRLLKELVMLSGAKTIIHGHYHKQKTLYKNGFKNVCLPSEKADIKDRFIVLDLDV